MNAQKDQNNSHKMKRDGGIGAEQDSYLNSGDEFNQAQSKGSQQYQVQDDLSAENQDIIRWPASHISTYNKQSQSSLTRREYYKIGVLSLMLIIFAVLILIVFKIQSLSLMQRLQNQKEHKKIMNQLTQLKQLIDTQNLYINNTLNVHKTQGKVQNKSNVTNQSQVSKQEQNKTLIVQIQNFSLCIILSQNIFKTDKYVDSNAYIPTLKNSIFSQSYQHWVLIAFTQQQQQNIQKGYDLLKQSEAQRKTFLSKVEANSSSGVNKFNILKSLYNKGQNIYNAIHHHCKNDSIVILLNQGQTFSDNKSLNIINQHFNKKNNYMATLQILDQEGKKQIPSTGITTYQRAQLYVDNRTVQQMKIPFQIIRFTRCFRAFYYKQIFYSQIMNEKMQFLNSSFSFLLILSQNFQFKVNKPINLIDHFSIPSIFSMINQTLIKQSRNFKNFISIEQIEQIRYVENKYSKQNYYDYYITKTETYALNLTNMHAQNKRRIPKIIHQIQIGNRPMTQFYRYLRSKIELLMPEYQYRLWTENNITIQNFPHSHKYIQALFQINKTFQYSRIAMIVDLMRLQIIYLHGGIYIDRNLQILKSFDYLTNLSFFSGRQGYPAQPHINNGFFGAQKNSSIIQKLLTQESLSKIKLRSKWSNLESGPAYLGSAISLQDYYTGEIFVLDPEMIYPYQYWKYGKMRVCACALPKQQKLMPHMTSSQLQWIQQGNFKIIKNCPYYKYSLSVDYFMLGGSWKIKKDNKPVSL